MAIVAAPSAKSANVQILTYYGKSFVTGLFWHPLGSLTGYMREARQFGRVEKMDIVAIRHTESIIQAGFVSRSAGAVKGMYSLAAALAGQLGSSWIAAWRVSPEDDRYALVAVYEGAVIPGSDLVGSADEIQRKVAQLLGRSINFQDTYLPPEFSRGGKPLEIEELLKPQNLRREYRLRPLAFGLSRTEIVKLSAVGTLIVGGLIGFQQWEAHNAQLALRAAIAAEQRRQAELDAMNLRSKNEKTQQALEHPWAKHPGVAEFIAGCNGAIDSLPLSISGWLFTSAQCDGELVSATFKRTGNSTAGGFIAATNNHFPDDPAFFDEGNSAALKLNLKLGLAGDDSLIGTDVVLALMTSWLHRQNLAPTIKEVPVIMPQPVALPGQPPPPPAPPPQWKHFEMQYSSNLPPSIVLNGLPESGVRLREIKVQLQTSHLTWVVTGDIYAK